MGCYEVWFIGKFVCGEMLCVIVWGDCDFGYGLICKFISEVVLCLV